MSMAGQDDIGVRRHNRDSIRLNRAPSYRPTSARPVVMVERQAVFIALGMPLRFLRRIVEAKDYPATVTARFNARAVRPHPAC